MRLCAFCWLSAVPVSSLGSVHNGDVYYNFTHNRNPPHSDHRKRRPEPSPGARKSTSHRHHKPGTYRCHNGKGAPGPSAITRVHYLFQPTDLRAHDTSSNPVTT